MGDAGESELTARAREVLAGLSDLDRGDLLRCGSAGYLCEDPDTEPLVAAGLVCAEDPAFRCDLSWTDLGREVARLLSEVQS